MSREIDAKTGLEVNIKQPSEDRLYTFDFSSLLGLANIASVTSIVASNLGRITGSTDLTLSNQAHNSLKLAQVRIADGQDGENYKITAIIVSNDSDTLESDGMLKVRNL